MTDVNPTLVIALNVINAPIRRQKVEVLYVFLKSPTLLCLQKHTPYLKTQIGWKGKDRRYSMQMVTKRELGCLYYTNTGHTKQILRQKLLLEIKTFYNDKRVTSLGRYKIINIRT